MAHSTSIGLSLLRATLLGATALSAIAPASADTRVGVTSAIDGDPKGKPPAEPERVLRIGIDVQASEIVTTGANDRAHLVFLDGTSLTVGPNAQLTIDKFVYDPATKTGDLAVSASKGVLRLVGGKISKSNAVTVTTPSATIGIRGGMGIIEIQQDTSGQPPTTTATYLGGIGASGNAGMTVTGAGQSSGQTLSRPGSQVRTVGGSAPGAPTIAPKGSLGGAIASLEGGGGGGGQQAGGGQGGGRAPAAGGGQQPGGGNADQGAANFGGQNSARGPSGNQPIGGAGLGPGPGGGGAPGRNNPAQNAQRLVPTNLLSNTNGDRQQASLTNTSTTQVTVSVGTLGRYIAGPNYTGFNNSTLAVTPTTANDRVLASTGSRTTTTTTTTTGSGSTAASSSTITINVPGKGSITLPWQTNTLTNGFSIGTIQDGTFGTLSGGTGFISPNGDYFAYVFNTTGGQKVAFFGGSETTATGTTNFPTSGVAAYKMNSIGNSGRIPFANGSVGDDTSLRNAQSVSNLNTVFSSVLTQTVGVAPPDARGVALQATVSISGQGSSQKSYMGIFAGTFLREITTTGGTVTSDNGMGLAGSYSGSYRLGADQQIGRQASGFSTATTGGGNAIYGTPGSDGAVAGMVITPDGVSSNATTAGGVVTNVTGTRTSQAAFDQPYTNLVGSDYYSVNVASKTTTPSSLGQTRTTQSLKGYAGGLVDQRSSTGTFSTRAVTTIEPSTTTLDTSATNNRAAMQIGLTNRWDTGTSATIQMGGLDSSTAFNSTSAFIDDNTYAVRERAGATTIAGSTTAVTGRTFVESYNAAPTPTLFSDAGVTRCTCAFLTWGWWGGEVVYDSTSTYNANGRDRLNLATYVAGTLTTSVNLPTTGTATFTGHVVANVQSGSNSYVAVGSYGNSWNFGTQTGSVTISNFDGVAGTNYTANTTLSAGTVNFSGSLTGQGTAAGRTGSINGSFFSSGTTAAAGQAGSLSVSGTNYKAAGTFAAQR